MNRHPIGRTALCAALTAAIMAGCGGGGSSGPVAVNLGTAGRGLIPFLIVEVAIDKGFFADEDINVTVVEVDGDTLPAALVSGSVNLVVNSIYDGARFRSRDIEMSYASGVETTVDLQLMAAEDSGLPAPSGPGGWMATFAALAGKNLGVPSVAGPTGQSTLALLQMAGLSEGDYTVVDAGGPSAFAALQAGELDAFITGGGLAPIAEAMGVGKIVVDFARDIPEIFGDQFFIGLGVSQKTLDDHPGIAERIQAAMRNAKEFMQDEANFDYLVQLAKKTGTPDSPILPDLIKRYLPLYSPEISLSGVQAALDWASKAGMIEAPVTTEDLIAPGVETSD